MIIGIGTDIIHIDRIEKAVRRFGKRFEERILTRGEQQAAAKLKNGRRLSSFYAKRFAAKEAVAKALGTGLGRKIGFQDIEISNKSSGMPVVNISGRGRDLLTALSHGKEAQLDISLSDDYPLATAMVIISNN